MHFSAYICSPHLLILSQIVQLQLWTRSSPFCNYLTVLPLPPFQSPGSCAPPPFLLAVQTPPYSCHHFSVREQWWHMKNTPFSFPMCQICTLLCGSHWYRENLFAILCFLKVSPVTNSVASATCLLLTKAFRGLWFLHTGFQINSTPPIPSINDGWSNNLVYLLLEMSH